LTPHIRIRLSTPQSRYSLSEVGYSRAESHESVWCLLPGV
jgi:hypothetical protein